MVDVLDINAGKQTEMMLIKEERRFVDVEGEDITMERKGLDGGRSSTPKGSRQNAQELSENTKILLH